MSEVDEMASGQGVWKRIRDLCRLAIDGLRGKQWQQRDDEGNNRDKDNYQGLLAHLLRLFRDNIFPEVTRQAEQRQLILSEGLEGNGGNGGGSLPESIELASVRLSLEPLQWKNNQKQVVRTTLEQVIVMLLNYNPSLVHLTEVQLHNAHASNPSDTQLLQAQSSHVPSLTATQLGQPDRPVFEYQQIHTCFNSGSHQHQHQQHQQSQSLNSVERTGLERALNSLRAERQNVGRYRQEKKRSSVQLWGNFGNLLNLERDRFDDMFIFDRVESVQQRILRDLVGRNSANGKIIKKFVKRSQTLARKKKLLRKSSFYGVLRNQAIKEEDESENREEGEFEEDKEGKEGDRQGDKENMTFTVYETDIRKPPLEKVGRLSWTKSCKFLKPASNQKLYTIRSRPKLSQTHAPIDLKKRSQLKSKAEASFKNPRKQKSPTRNILTNIVFDPSIMETSSKRRLCTRWSDKNLIRRMDSKPLKSSRGALRVGGVRLSLQEGGQGFLKVSPSQVVD